MADVIKEKLLSSILAEIARYRNNNLFVFGYINDRCRDRNGLDSNLSMVQAVLASFG